MASCVFPEVPGFIWQRLGDNGRNEFTALWNSFRKDTLRSQTGIFKSELEAIRSYVSKVPAEVIDRSIICGVFFAPNFICVNNRALKLLLGRCKSSINVGFQNLGYHSAKTHVRKMILNEMPILKCYPNLARQWTIRYLISAAPRKELPAPILTPVPVQVKEAVPTLSIGHVDISFGDVENIPGIDFDQIPTRVDEESCNKDFAWDSDLYTNETGKSVELEAEREDEWPSFGTRVDGSVELSNWKV